LLQTGSLYEAKAILNKGACFVEATHHPIDKLLKAIEGFY